VKQYDGTTNDDRRPQGVTSAQPHQPSTEKENVNQKSGQKKPRNGKAAQAKQGK
jgi:hypothetical protein